MLHVIDSRALGRKQGSVRIKAGMASESSAGYHGCHDQHRIGTDGGAQGEYNGRNHCAHAPERTGGKTDGRQNHKYHCRECRPGHQRLCHINDKVCHTHTFRHALKNKGDQQNHQGGQHICETADNQVEELFQIHQLLGNIHHQADKQRHHHCGQQVAGDYGEGYQDHHGNHKIPEISAFLIAFSVLMIVFAAGITVHLSGLFHTRKGFLHGTQLRHNAQSKQQGNQQGEDRIERERRRMHIGGHGGRKSHFLYAGLLPEQGRVKHRPGGEGKEHTVRGSGGIQHIRQTLSGELPLVTDILHADADGQHIQIIVHENQDTHDKGGQHRPSLIGTEFGHQRGKSEGSL